MQIKKAGQKQGEHTRKAMNTEPERGSKQKGMEELEVKALHTLTLMGTQTYTRCLQRNCAKPVNHRMIAAKPQT